MGTGGLVPEVSAMSSNLFVGSLPRSTSEREQLIWASLSFILLDWRVLVAEKMHNQLIIGT